MPPDLRDELYCLLLLLGVEPVIRRGFPKHRSQIRQGEQGKKNCIYSPLGHQITILILMIVYR